LVRVTAGSDADGRPAVVPDPAATRSGRGAHLHPTVACYGLAVRRRAFGRSLRSDVGLDSAPVASYLASLDSAATSADSITDSSTDSSTDRTSHQELEQ
jgi:predicted RNA-binding protein YlxR (DUF448 family)